MRAKGVIATAAGTGIAGFFVGKFTSSDLRQIVIKFLDGLFQFLHEEGPYVAFALAMAIALGAFCIWAIRQLIHGKQSEIDRLVLERDRFQMLFVDEWKSSRKKGK